MLLDELGALLETFDEIGTLLGGLDELGAVLETFDEIGTLLCGLDELGALLETFDEIGTLLDGLDELGAALETFDEPETLLDGLDESFELASLEFAIDILLSFDFFSKAARESLELRDQILLPVVANSDRYVGGFL